MVKTGSYRLSTSPQRRRIVRSSRSGAFRYRYRFSGSGRFAFRARVRFERAYPYVLGYSSRTSVSVG